MNNMMNRKYQESVYKDVQTMPGYLSEEFMRKAGVLFDYPVKYKPDYMYHSQISRVFPKEMYLKQLLFVKIQSIVEGIPFDPK